MKVHYVFCLLEKGFFLQKGSKTCFNPNYIDILPTKTNFNQSSILQILAPMNETLAKMKEKATITIHLVSGFLQTILSMCLQMPFAVVVVIEILQCRHSNMGIGTLKNLNGCVVIKQFIDAKYKNEWQVSRSRQTLLDSELEVIHLKNMYEFTKKILIS